MAALIQFQDGKAGVRLDLGEQATKLGRDPHNDICVDDSLVSREHAIIDHLPEGEGGGRYVIRDLGSTNGTYVNHEKVSAQVMNHGDVIRLGTTFFRFQANDSDALSETMLLQKSIIPGVYYAKEKKGKE